MSSESAYNKRLAPETAMDKVEGLLEHFNLPPKVITFIRGNKRILQVILLIIIVAVVTWSLYGSYIERIKEESATALSLAIKNDPVNQQAALSAVIEEYGSTSSAMWAKVELAHLDMKGGSFDKAANQYNELLKQVKITSPLYPLVVFGKAQALEALKSYSDATVQYDVLKEIKGYEHLAYVGKGRIQEAQGNPDKAIAIYNNFLLAVGDDPTFSQAKGEIDAKIARLKAVSK